MSERLLTVEEVAELLAVSPSTVDTWARTGELPAFTLPSGTFIREDELEEWLARAKATTVFDEPDRRESLTGPAADLKRWLDRAVRLPRMHTDKYHREAYVLLHETLRARRARPGRADALVFAAGVLGWALETIERLEDGCPICGTRRSGWRREEPDGVAVCSQCEQHLLSNVRDCRIELERAIQEQRQAREAEERDRLRSEYRERLAERAGAPASVYVFTAAGRVKVGIASDLKRRQRDLETQGGEPLELVCSWRLQRRDLAQRVEREVHRELAEPSCPRRVVHLRRRRRR